MSTASVRPPLAPGGQVGIQTLRADSSKDQTVACSGTAASSTTFTDACRVIRVISVTCDYHLNIGSNPTATTSNARYVADVEYYIAVQEDKNGDFVKDKISVIKASGETDGTVYISEMY